MSLTPRKTTTKALRRLTRALSEAGAPSTPVTIPARVLLRILDKLQNARFQATNEANRAAKNFLYAQELQQELNRRTQQAQDAAPTPDELLTPGSDYARGARAAAQEIHRALTGAGTDQLDDGITRMEPVRTALERLTGLLERAREDERARVLRWLQSSAGNPAVREYARLRTRYSAEHDAAHHERADFRTAALALLLRPDMKVAVVTSISNTGHEKVNALFTAEALWEGTGLGKYPGPPANRYARNDALAAALLMCSLDRPDTVPAQEEEEKGR